MKSVFAEFKRICKVRPVGFVMATAIDMTTKNGFLAFVRSFAIPITADLPVPKPPIPTRINALEA